MVACGNQPNACRNDAGLRPDVLTDRFVCLTCVLPGDAIRFVRGVRRRLRLLDEMSDSFLKMSVNASQQLHTIEGWFWKSTKTMAFENICSKLEHSCVMLSLLLKIQ